jgi:hypothetical protein
MKPILSLTYIIYAESKIVSWSGKMRFFKSSPVDEYHLPQMNSENVFLGVPKNEKGSPNDFPALP